MKIKILHIQETIQSGGVERIRLSMAKHLDEEVYEQKFVCTYAIGNIPEEIRAEGYEVISIGRLKSPLDWKQHRKIQKIIEEYKPDIIHGAVFEGVTMAAINGWFKKVPVIIIEETSYPKNRSWKGNLLMKFFSKISTCIIGVSEGVVNDYLRKDLNIVESKIKLINNGVLMPRKVTENEILTARKTWNINENDFVIGSVGRMKSDEIKRFSDMIKAFAIFSKNKENCKLLLVGGNKEYVQKYRDLVQELEISEKVIFTEYQSDVTLFYQLMDVFSLVSAFEAFGMVLAEAMLNNLPVVATRVGGMKYIVDDDETGILVEGKNIDQIANAYEKLYNNKNLRIKMGQNGYHKAMSEYTEEVYIKKIDELYNNLFKGKNIS